MQLKEKKIVNLGLVGLSLLLSIFSFFTKRLGNREPYPFFEWKLYTHPIGGDGKISYHRLGFITNNNDTILLKGNANSKLWDDDAYSYYFLKQLKEIQTAKNDSIRNDEINHLRIFALSLFKQSEIEQYDTSAIKQFFIQKETVKPSDQYKFPSQKEVVLCFQ